jgi:hypothetical protein
VPPQERLSSARHGPKASGLSARGRKLPVKVKAAVAVAVADVANAEAGGRKVKAQRPDPS